VLYIFQQTYASPTLFHKFVPYFHSSSSSSALKLYEFWLAQLFRSIASSLVLSDSGSSPPSFSDHYFPSCDYEIFLVVVVVGVMVVVKHFYMLNGTILSAPFVRICTDICEKLINKNCFMKCH